MQQSTHRILTTHVGSLARPDALMPLLRLKERGQPYDTETFARLVREAVADVVRKQVEAGPAGTSTQPAGNGQRISGVPTFHLISW